VRANFTNQYFIGHGIVLNCILLYYGSGKKIRDTIGYTASGHMWALRKASACAKKPWPTTYYVRWSIHCTIESVLLGFSTILWAFQLNHL